uniref:beta-galactosidase trimerization domain-containing protein n=1 Tax=Sphingobium sp. TaxID=1912891 RepID=UPI003B3AAD89
TYDNPGGWLDGRPAIVSRKVGKGRITYLGAWLEPGPMQQLADHLLSEAKVEPIVPNAHPDLEISERAGKGKRVLIVINHGHEARPLTPPTGAKLAQGQWQNGQMAPHGIALFELKYAPPTRHPSVSWDLRP